MKNKYDAFDLDLQRGTTMEYVTEPMTSACGSCGSGSSSGFPKPTSDCPSPTVGYVKGDVQYVACGQYN